MKQSSISQEINGGAFSRVLILTNFLLRLSPQSARDARTQNESEDTEATLRCKGPVIDLDNDDDEAVIDLENDDDDAVIELENDDHDAVIDLENEDDDAVIDLAHDGEDPAPLLGERCTWGLRARVSGLPEIWRIATL